MSEIEIKWPYEIFAAERKEHDIYGTHVYSEHGTVARWEGDEERDREFHRYIDEDVFNSQERYFTERLTQAELAAKEAKKAAYADVAKWAEQERQSCIANKDAAGELAFRRLRIRASCLAKAVDQGAA